MGDIAGTLSDFIAQWVQTGSGYDLLVATTMGSDWVKSHIPVFSSREQGHMVYMKYEPSEPNGNNVRCHMGCNHGLQVTSSNVNVKVMCLRCKSTCSFPKVPQKLDTTLGKAGLIKTRYPPQRYGVQWYMEGVVPPKERNPGQKKGKGKARKSGTGSGRCVWLTTSLW